MYLKSVSASFQIHKTLPFVARDITQFTTWELVFIIFGSAFTLGEYTSSSEHGWISELRFYFRQPVLKTTLSLHCERMFLIGINSVLCSIDYQIWNVFDLSFVVVFIGYLTLRIKGLSHHDRKTGLLSISQPKPTAKLYLVAASEMAFQVLCCGACILFPR